MLRDKIVPIFDGRLLSNKKIIQFNKWKKDIPEIKGGFGPMVHQSEPTTNLNLEINPEWLVGFTDGDGSFYPMIHKAKDYKCGFQVQLVFDIAQEEGDPRWRGARC